MDKNEKDIKHIFDILALKILKLYSNVHFILFFINKKCERKEKESLKNISVINRVSS